MRACLASFNTSMLRLARPGANWVLSCFRIALVAKVCATMISIVLDAGFSVPGGDYTGPSKRGLPEFAFLALIFAPLLETAQIWLLFHVLCKWIGLTAFVCANVFSAFLMHNPPSRTAFAATTVFFFMSYQYASFAANRRPVIAFWGVALTHCLLHKVVGK